MIADFVRVQPDDQNLKSITCHVRMIERLHRLFAISLKTSSNASAARTSTVSKPLSGSTSETWN